MVNGSLTLSDVRDYGILVVCITQLCLVLIHFMMWNQTTKLFTPLALKAWKALYKFNHECLPDPIEEERRLATHIRRDLQERLHELILEHLCAKRKEEWCEEHQDEGIEFREWDAAWWRLVQECTYQDFCTVAKRLDSTANPDTLFKSMLGNVPAELLARRIRLVKEQSVD